MDVDPNMAIHMMTRGGEFWKYHYRQVGRPSRVKVQLLGTGEDRALGWRDVGDREFAASIAINDITEVRKGPGSRTFAENQASIINPNMCFTIYTRGRTLDLEAVHPEDLKIWVSGIRHLINSAGRIARDPSNDANYTYINSRTKEEWLYDGGRMVQHRERAPGHDRGHGDMVEDLERHLDMACHADPLDSIEEWLSMKRQTTQALGPPPEPLDVDQWFKAGPYRNEIAAGSVMSQPQQQQCIPAFPTPSGGGMMAAPPQIAGPPPPQAPGGNDYGSGFQAGLQAAQQGAAYRPPPPAAAYGY
eukprot:TRINITY_DN1848_c4_g1_i1.p1 TRINITY_DN1848_c4_g1~~TRINITY_DN1848_c4_g1_i1.p1  ORF type:complete len:303 (+),score=62.09 TRINITY_DN1848_c4_g1_i1:93-1001(+)